MVLNAIAVLFYIAEPRRGNIPAVAGAQPAGEQGATASSLLHS